MRTAIAEAAKGSGKTFPNPAVGAVIVSGGKIISRGFHHAAGLPHAEIEALRGIAPGQTLGATLYVTLEPCSSHGKTPPCTGALIASGIGRVVYGATDPDKRHRGRAARILNNAGIQVAGGVLSEECAALNPHWNHRHSTGMPWVIAKAGMSLDGRIDSPPRRRWITSAASRHEAMHLRASVEAVLVGGGTVRTDDPSLTVRGIRLPRGVPQPWRVVWTKGGNLPKTSRLLTDPHRHRTIILSGMSLRAALKELARRGISSVLIEGGGSTLGEAFARKLVDEVRFFIAPIVQGGNVATLGERGLPPVILKDAVHTRIGADVMVSALVGK
jgi:diaminohydroxyphosphoribosylaminopyrimidine deaminase/5-amino-6-(5-phosphoribosylamino)uracil reductase